MDRERLFNHLEERYASKRDMIPRLPLGVHPDEIWRELLNRRRSKGTILPLTGAKGMPLWYVTTDRMAAASERIIDAMYEDNADIDPYAGVPAVSALEEVFYTGYVEGMQLTLREAMEFLAGDKPPRDIEEQLVYNNRVASSYAGGSLFRPIDVSILSDLAEILTEGIDAGGSGYRDTDDAEFSPSPGERFSYPSPVLIPDRIDELTAFLTDPSVHPLIKAGVAQIWMMTVRPFRDSNDRLGRLLSYMILLRAGYSFFADVSLSSLIARKSYAYYESVANTLREENGGDLTYFLDHFLELLARAVEERRLILARRNDEAIKAERETAREPLKPSGPPKPQTTEVDETESTFPDGFQLVPLNGGESAESYEATVSRLKTIADGPTQLFSKLAGFLLGVMDKGQTEFVLADAGEALGVNPRNLSTCIRLLKEQRVIEHDGGSNIKGLYRILPLGSGTAVRDDPRIEEPEQTVAGMLDELAASTLSAKDRRIAAMLKKCMDRGEIGIDDYRERGESKKWQDDMTLAVQLGLVEKITAERYRIRKELEPARSRMTRHQKRFITDVYESFGTETFSREMITATLDYSGTNLSAYLHKFTLLKILDCQRDGLMFLYQLRVNPKEHPECFDHAA